MFKRSPTDAFGAPVSSNFRRAAVALAAAGAVAGGGGVANAQPRSVSIAGLQRIGQACKRLAGFKVCTFATKDPNSTNSNRYRIATSIKAVKVPHDNSYTHRADEKVIGPKRETSKGASHGERLSSDEWVTSRMALCAFTPTSRELKATFKIAWPDKSDGSLDPNGGVIGATLSGTLKSERFDTGEAGCGVPHSGRSASFEVAEFGL